ncbi:MAG TPA: NAD-dependent epimerase/dehydratase family protein [Armatimonadota bacterium]|nr:NAD-dependent epimerase/dehydratase family protein [Armatimonadota bacterium]HOS43566.1 NAD-dependent epimerase/dehydratase family protein [Armatimonadota bacterium]
MTLQGKTILVTGGAGFIGSHVVERLAAEDPARVIVVDDCFLGAPDNLDTARLLLGDRLRCHWQDAGDFDAMRAILDAEPVDVVYNMAVIPLPTSLERPKWTAEKNVVLTTTICELQREGRFQTLIHFSSSEVYGTAQYVPIDEGHPYVPSTPYAASKLATDYVALSYRHTFGLDIAVIRPFNNYGPRQNSGSYAGIIPIVVTRVLAGTPIAIFGDGLQTRDFIFVRDTAEAAVRVYREPRARGRVVNIATGRECTVNDLVARLLHALGADTHPVVHVEPRLGDVRRHLAGTALAAELLDFTATTPLEDGLTQTVQWYLTHLSRRDPAAVPAGQ